MILVFQMMSCGRTALSGVFCALCGDAWRSLPANRTESANDVCVRRRSMAEGRMSTAIVRQPKPILGVNLFLSGIVFFMIDYKRVRHAFSENAG